MAEPEVVHDEIEDNPNDPTLREFLNHNEAQQLLQQVRTSLAEGNTVEPRYLPYEDDTWTGPPLPLSEVVKLCSSSFV